MIVTVWKCLDCIQAYSEIICIISQVITKIIEKRDVGGEERNIISSQSYSTLQYFRLSFKTSPNLIYYLSHPSSPLISPSSEFLQTSVYTTHLGQFNIELYCYFTFHLCKAALSNENISKLRTRLSYMSPLQSYAHNSSVPTFNIHERMVFSQWSLLGCTQIVRNPGF